MSNITYADCFQLATCSPPYQYQCRLACGPAASIDEPDTLRVGTRCESQLIEIPTGLGKTAAVVLAWLWNRVLQPDVTGSAKWPRRLVYCLPMRTLVEQTEREIRRWLGDRIWNGTAESRAGKIGVHVLMGGEEAGEWGLYPEEGAILIGTQDMLLSRALNRGYGMSRYRWPMHFGLLNNDALWVMDETQLMGVAVETSAQLDGFRTAAERVACPTWWMSATLDRRQLSTVDHREPAGGWPRLGLEQDDLSNSRVAARVSAVKSLHRATFALDAETKKAPAKPIVELIKAKHTKDTLTLVIVNRVPRAQAIYEALLKTGFARERLALIHSRFRPADREKHQALLAADGDRIIIATQAIEAGVDLSARLLITELAPWPSLVQRFGRCNRAGEFPSEAEVIWIDIDNSSDDLCLPYTAEDLQSARSGLEQAAGQAGPAAVAAIRVAIPPVVRPVLRRKDLLDLFDTTPDLCGNDLDISRYVRDGEDTDVQFYWRAIPADGPDESTTAPHRSELCRVSVAEFDKFLKAKAKPRVFIWNALEEAWQEPKRARPGAVYLVDAASGGYSEELGWTREPKHKPTPLEVTTQPRDGISSDRASYIGHWLTLDQHSQDVVAAARALIGKLDLLPEEVTALDSAALWHDVGKAHSIFQQALRSSGAPPLEDALWAKSENQSGRSPRKGFRHELASALAWLVAAPADATERDLVAYLIAAHHGKVRLSIRALPNELPPDDSPDLLQARGVQHGEELPAAAFPGGGSTPIRLDLSFMKMGEGPHGASWLARTVALRDRLGPFRLAYLETLLRVADMRASAAAAASPQP